MMLQYKHSFVPKLSVTKLLLMNVFIKILMVLYFMTSEDGFWNDNLPVFEKTLESVSCKNTVLYI